MLHKIWVKSNMFSIDQENTVERGIKYLIHVLGVEHFQSTQNTSINLPSTPHSTIIDTTPHVRRGLFFKDSHQSSWKHSKQKENYPKKQTTKLTTIVLSTKLRMEKEQFFNKFQKLWCCGSLKKAHTMLSRWNKN